MSFISLVLFISRYFILCDVTLNRIVFLLFLSDSSLFVCRKATDFCILILYPATSLNSFISSISFSVETLGFSIYSLTSSVNIGSFNSSFPIWLLFIYFSSLITVAKTSNSTLNRSGESGHLCLVSDFKIKAFRFPFVGMLAVGLS